MAIAQYLHWRSTTPIGVVAQLSFFLQFVIQWAIGECCQEREADAVRAYMDEVASDGSCSDYEDYVHESDIDLDNQEVDWDIKRSAHTKFLN